MEDFEKIENIEMQVALIKRDIAAFSTLFAKLDVTVDKMTEVSNNINRLLSIHEQRIQSLSEQDRLLDLKLEKNNTKLSEDIKEVQKELQGLSKDITSTLKSHEEGIKNELKGFAASVATQNDNAKKEFETKIADVDKRLAAIEKWRWMVIGGSLALGWIVSKIPLSQLFM